MKGKNYKSIDKFLSSTAGSVGGTSDQPMMITQPLLIMFEQDNNSLSHSPKER